MTKERRTKERKEGSGTPTDAVFHVRTSGCGSRHGEIGLRRPSAAGALACRRSTDGSNSRAFARYARLQARLPGTWPERRSVTSPFRRQNQTQFVRALPAPTCPSPVTHLTDRS